MGIGRTRRLRYGIHPTAKDTSTLPTSYKFLDLKSSVLWDPEYNYQDRSDYPNCSNEPLDSVKLSKKLEGLGDITVEMTGLDTAASSGVSSSTADFPLAELYESCFASFKDGEGLTGSATPLTGAQMAFTSAVTSNEGCAVLVPALDGTINLIELGVKVGNNHSTDRAITDAFGVASTAAADAVVHASRSYYADSQTPDRKHLYFDADNTEWRREIYGALLDLGFKFNSGGLADVTLKSIMFTDWLDSAANGVPCSEPSAGLKIPVYGMRSMIGNTLYNAYDIEIGLGMEKEAAKSDGAANGVSFYTVTRSKPWIKLKLRTGTGTNPHEALDDTVANFRADGTFDVSILFGTQPTAAIGFRFPAVDFANAKRIDDGGLEAIQLEGMATKVTTGNSIIGNSPMRMHIF